MTGQTARARSAFGTAPWAVAAGELLVAVERRSGRAFPTEVGCPAEPGRSELISGVFISEQPAEGEG
ncbi:MAG: hypothetical protein M3540_06950 [Actinomycetota bacterium]|nr:hypothetical protein [Actinomycetota bacterium]